MTGGNVKTLSQRHAVIVDAYEEFLIVKGVRDTIDECELLVRRHRGDFREGPYFVLPGIPQIQPAVWYIEASPETQRRAATAVDEACKRYEEIFAWMTHGQPERRAYLTDLGAVAPEQVAEAARQRSNREPWWAQFVRKEPLSGWDLTRRRPEGGDYRHGVVYCITDPADAVAFYRRDWTPS